MTAEELLKAGHLSAAVEQLNQEVRSRPTDIQRRTFLFELLCFAGDYQRAERQLDVLGHQSAMAEIGCKCIATFWPQNRRVSGSSRRACSPTSSFPRHLTYTFILRLYTSSATISRQRLGHSWRSAAFPTPLKGSLARQPFTAWRDDDLLAPFLEVIVHNQYVWLPFEQIKRLHIMPPKRLRDLLWVPATLKLIWPGGGGVPPGTLP